MDFFAGCQNSLPELLFGCELPPTLIDLLLEDAPKVLNRVEVRRGWGFCTMEESGQSETPHSLQM